MIRANGFYKYGFTKKKTKFANLVKTGLEFLISIDCEIRRYDGDFSLIAEAYFQEVADAISVQQP
jgi:hypothetical protein